MSDTATATPEIEAMSPQELFQHLWQTKYVAEIVSVLRRESERRADAFADGVTFTVCGEEIRMMTPRDLLMLDGFENAFVCLTEPTPADLKWFVWTLSNKNDGTRSWANLWRKGRTYARIDACNFEEACGEVYHYLDRLWIDTPAGETKDTGGPSERAKKDDKPPGVYCLASLMVSVAGTMGAVDPMSGRLLADTPISRLLQYQRAAGERTSGERDATSFDSYRSRCLEDVNNIMAERRARAAEKAK